MTSPNRLRALWDFAGSKNFSVFLLVTASTYVLVLAVFGTLVETRWLDIIAGLYPYRLMYALFFLNLLLCGIAWSPSAVRRCMRNEPPEPGTKPGRLQHSIEIPAPGFRIEDLGRRMRRRGYAVEIAGRGSGRAGAARFPEPLFYATRGRFSPAGNLLFHAGFVLLLVGAVTNMLYRFEGTTVLPEGGSFTGAKEEYRRIVDPGAGRLPRVDFDVEKVSAEFWRGRVFFTGLEAQLVHRGGREVARLSETVRAGDAEVTISGFGYAPLVELKDRSGEIVVRAPVKVNVFPPGAEDYFFIPGYPHKIFVSFFPDHAEASGRHFSKSMDPVNPAYFLRILRGKIPVYTGLVKQGAWADFDGLSVSFPSFVRTGDFRIVVNPGHPFVWAAFVVMGVGLAWRIFFYRKEVALWRDSAGRTWLSGHFDYFPKLNGAWLERLADEFGSKRG